MVEGEYSMILIHITLVFTSHAKKELHNGINRQLEIIRVIEVDKNSLDVVARELKINRCLQRWKV